VTDSLRRWELAGLAALAVIVAAVPLSLLRPPRVAGAGDVSAIAPEFTGSGACKSCHEAAYAKWKGSHHERAMDVASDATVLGDFAGATFTHRGVTSRFFRRDGKFYVSTQGPDGKPGEFQITHTFGLTPLQQYLVPLPGGRLQCLTVAWDTVNRRWFSLYPDQEIPPDDWLHWTRNAQNWNGMCAECHSTNLKKNYDPETETYATTWSEISVGCEACHGPGSRHVAWAKLPDMARPATAHQGLVVPTAGISSTQVVELCAPCHSRRAELGDYDHTGRRLLDHALPALLDEGLYHADGQQQDEVYIYASFLQSKMYARGVKCSDCHDSHSAKLLRDGNALCLQCHQPEAFDTAAHHFHKAVVDGKPSDGARCVTCHMPERTYMVVDPRADHSFRIPRPDLTVDLGVPNACSQAGCHADKPVAWSVDAYRRWYGLARRPHFGPTFAAARAVTPGADADLLRLVGSPLQPAIVRATALSLLARYPGADAMSAIQRALIDDDPLLRRVAVSGLAGRPADERARLLVGLLSDPVKAVRLDAASALADLPASMLKPYQHEALERGFAEYEKAMAYSLDFSSAGMNLGNLYQARGQPALAEKNYRLALKVDDLFFPAKVNLAVLLSAQGRNADAEQLLREVVRAYPGNAVAAYSLGLLLVETGKPQEAVGYLQQSTVADPRHARARYNLGLLLQQLGRAADAEETLRAALALEPANPDFLLALADHYLQRGRARDALPLADRLIAAAPDQRAGHELRALALQAMKSERRQ
jgi:predicted CXXCH cytochrome family protein